MAVAFTPGQLLGAGDLDIFLTNSQGNPANAAEIYYAVYYVSPGPPEAEVIIGPDKRTPINPNVGEYYASLLIPANATVGNYRIRWTFKELLSHPYQQVVQEFAVVAAGTQILQGYTTNQAAMISKLRLLTRDQNPDKFYRFRPPEHEGTVGQFNRVFGQIWEDAELLEYLERALDWFNSFPPLTTGVNTIDKLVNEVPHWRTAILWSAISHACFALQANWSSDEFSYSVGGISLDLDKSSKYDQLRSSSEQQFERAIQAKLDTVKFVRGLSQPRFGLGVRSALGPNLGRGILGPRRFI